MKSLKMKFVSYGFAFVMLAGTLTAVNLKQAKKVYAVGAVGPDGGIVLRNDVKEEEMVKRTPFLSPTDPYYTGASKADDPLYQTGKQYYQNVSMDNVGDIESTWDKYTGKGSLIAVIDSGIEYDHEDFKRDGESIISDKSAYFETDEYTGTVSIHKASSEGWSVLSHDYESDGQGGKEWVDHGSNVSGSAAASNNGVGTVGIAPGANILALKIDFYDPSIIEAIKYAADNGADVINLSLGGFDTDDCPSDWRDYASAGTKTVFKDAIDYAYDKGVIVVAAAGNESTDCKSYPACNDHVISVGALEPYTDKFDSEYSNYNKSTDTASTKGISVDITAPGSVCAPGIKDPTKSTKTLGYHFTSGTSFSSPIVAGAAALWKEKYPNGTPDEFEEDLYDSAYKCSSYSFRYYGHGNLDVYNLLDMANDGVSVDAKSFELNTKSSDVTVTATSKEGTISSWVSGNTNVVTVSGATGSVSSTATIHVVGAGSTTITVSDSLGQSATISVTVSQYVAVNGISVSENIEVKEGKKVNLNASVLPTNATNKEIEYVSNDTSVATVSEEGQVTGVAVGETTLTLTAEEVTKTINVNVVEATDEEYQIVFSSSQQDGREELDDILDIVESGGSIISSTSSSRAYEGVNGLKLGSRNNNGSFSLTFTESLNITSITVKACYYNTNTSATITVGNKTINSLTSSLADYKLTYDGTAVSTLSVSAKSRVYIKSLTIVSSATPFVPTTLESISLNTSNVQKTFIVDDTFSSQGLVVTASYSDGTSKPVTNFSVSKPNMSTSGSKTVTVSYTEDGVTKSATYSITVNSPASQKTLSSISLSGSYKTTFTVGDTFSSQGLVVTAFYSDGTSQTVTGYTVSKPDMSTAGNKTVTISYAEDNVSVTATYEIVVNEKPAPVSSGCGGNIVATSVVLSALAAVGVILLLIKRKKEN